MIRTDRLFSQLYGVFRITIPVWSLIFLYILLIADCVSAADTLSLTLDDCIALALEKSPASKVARLDSLAAAGDWLGVTSTRFPQLKLSGEAPDLSRAVDYRITYNPLTGRDEFKRVSSGDQRWRGSVELEQDLPWGANLSLSTGLYRNTWFDDRIGSGEDTTEYSLWRRVSLVQPLLAGNPVGRSHEIGRIAWERSRNDYQLQVKRIKYNATQLFFGLVSATWALEISGRDLDYGRSAEELARRKLQAGLIPEVELLQIQVDLARREGDYRQAVGAVEAAADRLKTELGLPLDMPVLTHWTPSQVSSEGSIPVDTTGERLELIQQQLSLRRMELETRAAMWTERIQAALQLNYDLENRHNELDLLNQPDDRNIGLILHFQLPLFGFGSTRGRIERLKADAARTRVNYTIQKAELLAELREALRSIRRAADRIQIAEAALDLSQRSYEITEGRFESGLVDSRALLDAQLDLTRSHTVLLNARIDYEIALANLERISPR